MKSVKVMTAAARLTAAAAVLAPPAQRLDAARQLRRAHQQVRPGFVGMVRLAVCNPRAPDCLDISAIPRLKFYAYYDGDAHLANGQWTLKVDVPDGLRCLPGYSMPTRDTYSWDEVSLAGTIESVYNVGCFNGPPGTQFWTFALKRL